MLMTLEIWVKQTIRKLYHLSIGCLLIGLMTEPARSLDYKVEPHPTIANYSIMTITDTSTRTNDNRTFLQLGAPPLSPPSGVLNIGFYKVIDETPLRMWCNIDSFNPVVGFPFCQQLWTGGGYSLMGSAGSVKLPSSQMNADQANAFLIAGRPQTTFLIANVYLETHRVCAQLTASWFGVQGVQHGECLPIGNVPTTECGLDGTGTTIDYGTVTSADLRPGIKQSSTMNIRCTGGGGTATLQGPEYDATGKKVIRNDNGDDLYAIITAETDGGETPVNPTGNTMTLVEGNNPFIVYAEIRANEPQKHGGPFSNTSVITITFN